MKRSIIVFFVLFLCLKVNAQNIIKGHVTDESNVPLLGVEVYIPDVNKLITTDQNGYYELGNIPNGNMKIKYSFLGYNTKIKSVILNNTHLTLNIVLKPSVINTPEIVVTGNYINSQHDNIVKIDVMDDEDIETSGSPNIMESISKVPGVDMISKGQGIAKPVIRGLSMNNVLVLNNGFRIENYQFSEDHPIGIDDSDVGRIEVIKGPASLLYGSDAIGGVLNFVKDNPAPEGKVIGDYRLQLYSNSIGINNSLGLKGATNNFFWGINASQKSHADYKEGGGDIVPNSRFSEWTANSNFGYTSKIGTFRVYYDYFKQKLGITNPASLALVSSRGRKNEVFYQNLDHHLLSTKNVLYLGQWKIDANASYQDAIRKLNTAPGITAVEMNLNTVSYETKIHFPYSDKSEYLIGIQGLTQKNRNHNDRIAQFLSDADINNVGILGMAQLSLIENLKIQTGIRYDWYRTKAYEMGIEGSETYHAPIDKKYSNLNGSLGFSYNLYDKMLFRLNFAKGYRVPNISELTSNGLHDNRYEVGNSDLLAQDSYETDASVHYERENLVFDVSLFYNKINNYIFVSPTDETSSDGAKIYRYSQTDAKLYGGEAGFHYHPGAINWLHFKTTYSYVIGKEDSGSYLPFIPANKLRFEVRFTAQNMGVLNKPSFQISTLTAFDQNNPSAFETSTSGYTLVNLNLYSVLHILGRSFEMSLAANNIFDKKYIDHLSTLKDLGYGGEGRNISLTLKVPIIN